MLVYKKWNDGNAAKLIDKNKPKYYGRAVEIKEMRKEGLTQQQIADELGIDKSVVRKYMRKFSIS